MLLPIYEHASDAIEIADADARILHVNPAFERVTGYTQAEAVGKTAAELFRTGLEGANFYEQIRSTVLRDGLWRGELLARRKDGSLSFQGVTITPAYNEQGDLTHYVTLRHDLGSHKRQVEEQLHLLESVVVHANDAIVITEAAPLDRPGPRILYVNDAFCRMSGYTAQELVGKTPRILQGPRSDRQTLDRLRQALANRQPIVVELINYSKSGNEYCVELSIVPVIGEQGICSHFIAIQRDITERKHLEQTLKKSEQRYRQLIDTACEGIWTLDAHACTDYVNQHAAAMLGYTVEEMLGRPLFDFMDAEATREAKQLLARRQQGIQEQHDFRFRRKDGSTLWAIVSTNAILGDDGQFLGALGMLTDITERKQVEQTLRENEERFRMIAEAIPVPIVITRRSDGVVLYANTHAGQVFGLGSTEPVGCTALDFYCSPQDRQVMLSALAAKGFLHDYEVRVKKADGTPFWVALSVQSLTFNGAPSLFTVFYDLTERKQAEEHQQTLERNRQMEAQMQRLQELNQLKDDFLSTVSHELRTPLSNMKLAIRMLEQCTSQEQRERYLPILKAECARETELINDLLDLQRLENGNIQIRQEAIVLQDWLPALLEPFFPRAEQRRQHLHLDLAAEIPPVYTDRNCLERILSELVNNACKYTPPDEEIFVQARSTGEKVVLSVCNLGAEIPVEALPHLFDKFYRVPGSDLWQQGGTGLGLALIQRLVQRLQGSIRVESHSKRTLFEVELPVFFPGE